MPFRGALASMIAILYGWKVQPNGAMISCHAAWVVEHLHEYKQTNLVNAYAMLGIWDYIRGYCIICIPNKIIFLSNKTIIHYVLLKLESLSGSKFLMFLVLSALFLWQGFYYFNLTSISVSYTEDTCQLINSEE